MTITTAYPARDLSDPFDLDLRIDLDAAPVTDILSSLNCGVSECCTTAFNCNTCTGQDTCLGCGSCTC
jgi:hypothetical protein